MGVKLVSASGGSVELVAPATATNYTQTLPANSGTVLTNKTAGTVLQVVTATTSTGVSNSTTTYADTGLTATITPSSASNTILVIVSQSCYKTTGNISNAVNIKLFRNAVDLGRKLYVQNYTATATELYTQGTFTYLDSPASTSALTYKTQFANQAAASAVSVQPDNLGVSTITLMEIAA